MSFFDGISKNSQPNKVTNDSPIGWNDLTELKQLDDLAAASFKKPVLIFKHSTRCGVSRMVLKNFEKHYALNDDDISPWFLDLLAYRDVSNEIASRFGVVHQSPQLILISRGECIYTASHSDIDANDIQEKIGT